MTKRKIEITDKRAGGETASREGNGAHGARTELVDLGEMQTHVDVPTPPGNATVPDCDNHEASGDARATDLDQLRAQSAKYLDLAQRKEAELRNYVRRVQHDLDDARRFAIESLLEDLFPVLDGLAQAARTYKDSPEGGNPLLDGLRGTLRALEAALLKHGIARIDEAGVPYDAEIHQALSVDGDGGEEVVAEVYVQGYRLGDKVLKPAMVRVEKR
jgi:molecular chaperone GrpE